MVASLEVRRLGQGELELAARLFALMAEVFEEEHGKLSDAYLESLLSRQDFWGLAALRDGELLGGLTAHVLPMTHSESSELFVYDVAVRTDVQRQGVGRALLGALREQAGAAGIEVIFVPADNDDSHALDFYKALGGAPSPVTIFTWEGESQST